MHVMKSSCDLEETIYTGEGTDETECCCPLVTFLLNISVASISMGATFYELKRVQLYAVAVEYVICPSDNKIEKDDKVYLYVKQFLFIYFIYAPPFFPMATQCRLYCFPQFHFILKTIP